MVSEVGSLNDDYDVPDSTSRAVQFYERRRLAKMDKEIREIQTSVGAKREIRSDPDTCRYSTLIYSMGEAAEDVFQSFGLEGDDAESYQTVLARFESYCTKKKNTIYERAKFNS
jgi:hypothetical protein